MKKSVNGKSFDEIFEERGEEHASHIFKVGNPYFYVHSVGAKNYCIFEHLHKNKASVSAKSCLVLYNGENEMFCKDNKTGLDVLNKVPLCGTFYEATLNQIALLNAYK